MPYFVLQHVASVESAINAVASVQGAYQSVKLLAAALDDVEQPRDFPARIQEVEKQQPGGHQGPEEAGTQVVKAVKTAENSSGEIQDKLLELVSLVLTRLGYSQGSRVLSLLLVACSIDPSLTIVVFKLCVLLSRTKTGRRLIAAALPRLKEVAAGVADRTSVDEAIRQIVGQMGDKAKELLSTSTSVSFEAAKRTRQAGERITSALFADEDSTGNR